MVRRKKVRMVVLVRPELLTKYRDLARQFGVSRNDLCRYALEHGYHATATWCRRQHDVFAQDDRQFLVNPPGPDPPASGGAPASTAVPLDDALRRYAQVVVRQESALVPQTFRTLLLAQAAVLGLPGPAAEPLVEAIVAEYYPAPVDGVESGRSDDDSADADSDTDSDLPALDPTVPVVDLD